jgi:hypothetical protein
MKITTRKTPREEYFTQTGEIMEPIFRITTLLVVKKTGAAPCMMQRPYTGIRADASPRLAYPINGKERERQERLWPNQTWLKRYPKID